MRVRTHGARTQWLREQLYTVRLRARASLGPTAILNQPRRAFETATLTMRLTKTWCVTHP
jgi:hypothetical protein